MAPSLLALVLSALALAPAGQDTRPASSRFFRGSFSPAELAPSESTPAEGYAVGLGLAMAGRFDEASLRMAPLQAQRDSPLHARIVREADRIELYRKERRGFLEHLQTSGRKLNLRKSALKLLAPIEEVRESEVVLGKNRAKIDVLQLDDIDAMALSEAMWKSDYPASFISAYPLVLQGEGAKKAVLQDGSKDARELLADLESGFDGNVERAGAARLLGELARMTLPVPAGMVKEALASIEELADRYGSVDLVRDRKPLLQRMAAEVLSVRFEEEGLRGILRGFYEPLGDGRMRVSYGFHDPKELEDFVVEDYLKEHAFAEPGKWQIKDKHLKTSRLLSMRHILDFEGEVTVRATWLYPEQVSRRYLIWLGINDDEEGNFVAAKPDGGLIVIDGPNDSVRDVTGDFRWRYDELYTLEIRYDGDKKAYCTVNGEAQKSLDAGPRKAGGVFLFACSMMRFQLHEFVIEGQLGAATMSRLQDEWMGREIGALGL